MTTHRKLLVCLGMSTVFLTLSAANAATISLKCKSGTVTVSNGSSTGDCGNTGGKVTCSNSDGGNKASGSCEGGVATCSSASGSGSCTIAGRLSQGTGGHLVSHAPVAAKATAATHAVQ